MIKPVKIKYLVGMGYTDLEPSVNECVDKLFLPSFGEVGGLESMAEKDRKHYVKEIGSRYGVSDTEQHILQYYLPLSGNSSSKLIKGPNNANAEEIYENITKSEWWTRSPIYTNRTDFQGISSVGGARYGYSTFSAKNYTYARVSFAFCI